MVAAGISVAVLLTWTTEVSAHHGETTPSSLAAALLIAFLFGLLGEAHCFGMCGPLVALYATPLRPGASRAKRVLALSHLRFNAGRIICYATLGFLVAGLRFLLTARFDLTGPVGLAVGTFVILMGLHLLGLPSWVPGLERALGVPYRLLARLFIAYRRVSRGPGLFALGLLHGFLPCSLLLTMFPLAAVMGDPLQSALFMAAFGLGTVPVMGGLGLALNQLRSLAARRMRTASGGVIMLWGVFLIVHGLDALGWLWLRYEFPRIGFYRLQEFLGVAGR